MTGRRYPGTLGGHEELREHRRSQDARAEEVMLVER
jgi:hypothetical protein